MKGKYLILIYLVGIVVIMLLFSLPFLGVPSFYLTLLTLTYMYISLSLCWNWLGGFAGYLNLGHAAFFGVGAYFSAMLAIYYKVPQLLSAPFAGLLAAVLALGLGFAAFRFRGVYFGIVTISLVFIFLIFVTNLDALGGGRTLFPPPLLSNNIVLYQVMLGSALVTSIVTRFILKSKLGWGLIAIRGDEDTAACIGVPVFRYKLLTFALSSFFAGLVGAIYPLLTGVIYPSMVFNVLISVNPVLMSILGGTTYLMGPVIGAAILLPISYYLSYILMSELHIVLYGALLIALVTAQPKGLAKWLFKETRL
jgi:branched-chain amino acid transport system permease protein